MGRGTGLTSGLVVAALFFFLLSTTVQRVVLNALRPHDRVMGTGR